MGSTRFLKVARAKTDEGLVVVKVFVKHDPSLPLEEHIEEIKCIKTKLLHASNCLPFQQVFVSISYFDVPKVPDYNAIIHRQPIALA